MKSINSSNFSFLVFFKTQRAFSLFVVNIILFLIYLSIWPDKFFTTDNLNVVLMNMSAESFILIAIALSLIMGEIDLSLGPVMILSGILCGRLMIVNEAPTLVAILIPLLVSLVLGLINGLIVTKLNVVAFIGTLATGMIYLSIAIILAGAGWTNFKDPMFLMIGRFRVGGVIQLPIIYMIFMFGLFTYLMARTRYFRRLYFIGGNKKAAMLSGINIDKTKITIFMIISFLASLAGIIAASRFNASLVSSGGGVELRAISAAVIGGISFFGGVGTMLGAAMGVLFLALLANGLSMSQVTPDIQTIITGIVLILALSVDFFTNRRSNRLG